MADRRNRGGGNGNGAGIPHGAEGSDYRFPASSKVYLAGTLSPDVRVPMREIRHSPTHGHNGGPSEQNPPFRVYDTSGPYTDPAVAIDLRQGLPPVRARWIRTRAEYDEVEPSYRAMGNGKRD